MADKFIYKTDVAQTGTVYEALYFPKIMIGINYYNEIYFIGLLKCLNGSTAQPVEFIAVSSVPTCCSFTAVRLPVCGAIKNTVLEQITNLK